MVRFVRNTRLMMHSSLQVSYLFATCDSFHTFLLTFNVLIVIRNGLCLNSDSFYLSHYYLLVLGDGIFHKYLMFVCGMCMMGVITETLVVSYIVTSAECDLSLTMTDKGLLTGAAFFGTSH